MSRLLNYVPLHLSRAVEELRSDHPDRSLRDVSANLTILDSLRERLRVTEWHDIPQLAIRLKPIELRSSLHLILEEDLRDKALELLRSRPRRDVMATGFRFLLSRYPERELESLIKEWAGGFGWDPLRGPRYSGQNVERWYSEGTIDLGLMRDWERQFAVSGVGLDDWLSSLELDRFDGLESHCAMWLLTTSKPTTLSKVGARALIDLAEQQVREVQAGFSRHYLCDLRPSDRWEEAAIKWILEKWGKPTTTDIQNPFWRSIPPEIRDEVRSWQALRELQSLLQRFKDPHGRFKFWEPFVKRHIRDFKPACRDPYTRQFSAICMEFDGWGAIEFGPVGNATYVYPLPYFRKVVARSSIDPSSYKDRRETIKGGPEGDGRIIHRAGWQESNRPWIQQLINRRGK